MANTTIDQLSSLAGSAVANTDLLLIYDASTNTEKFIEAIELKNAIISSTTLGSADFPSYATGTFTPEVSDQPASGNVATLSGAYGHYTKIGRQVTVMVSITNIDTTGLTGTNDFYIRGLPFQAVSMTGGLYGVGSVLAHTLNYAGTLTNLSSVILDNTSYIRLSETVVDGEFDFITINQISSGITDIYTSITYFAAS